MKRDQAQIKAELVRLQRAGVIHPADVVEAARDESSPLHPCFTWDDSEAAHQYRLIQARKLLQVFVHVEPGSNTTVRAFVSLTTDRVAGGGYRTLVDVMSEDEARAQLLQDALVQLNNMRLKYRNVIELARVWDAVQKVEADQSKKKGRKGRARQDKARHGRTEQGKPSQACSAW